MARKHGRRRGPRAQGMWAGRNSGLAGTTQGTSEYVHPNVAMNPTGTESDAQLITTAPIDLVTLAINVTVNNVENESTVVARIDGLDTDVSVAIPAGGTGNFSGSGRGQADAENAITLEITAGGGSVGDSITVEKWSLEYEFRSH